MTVPKIPAADEDLVIGFANFAAHAGWSLSSLRSFCEANGISEQETRVRWPKGIRSMAWKLNEYADAKTLAGLERSGSVALSQVMMRRFAENESLRDAVAALARSDAFHPVDTLARTAQTARIMWRCQGRTPARSSFREHVQTWGLVALYSACVLVWLGDTSASKRAVHRAVRLSAMLLGAN